MTQANKIIMALWMADYLKGLAGKSTDEEMRTILEQGSKELRVIALDYIRKANH